MNSVYLSDSHYMGQPDSQGGVDVYHTTSLRATKMADIF